MLKKCLISAELNTFAVQKFRDMTLSIKEIFTATMVLFAVIDIIGNIPIIIGLRKKVGHIQSEKASVISGVIMIAFLFLGKSILNLIGIDVNSFAVAGAFILFFLAFEMILGVSFFKEEEVNTNTASVFPLAFPLLAGPGSLTSILALRAEFETVNIVVAIVLNILILYAVLKTSSKIERLIGENGILIIRKIFGVVLLAIAVKLFASNVKLLY
jgi:multiple antibiotic resistance protein